MWLRIAREVIDAHSTAAGALMKRNVKLPERLWLRLVRENST